MKGIVIKTNNTFYEKDFPQTDDIREEIGGWLEIVKPIGLGYWTNLRMVVDEDGRLKEKPLNTIGSFWYGFFEHGEPIVGDIVLLSLDREGNLVSIDDYAIQQVKKHIESLVEIINSTKDKDKEKETE